MAKQRKVWKSSALDAVNFSKADKVRQVLIAVAKGEHPAIADSEKLYDLLCGMFRKIEDLKKNRETLEMLSWFLNCDAYFTVPEEDFLFLEDIRELFGDAVSFFSEMANESTDRAYVINLMHDLLLNAVSEYDARFDLFFAVRQFMSAEEIRQLADEVLETLDKHSLENENEVFAGILDVADAAGDAPLYEKIMFRRDPDRKNGSLIAAANAYYVAGDIPNANRLLNEVQNPVQRDEEEFLDLKVGILFKEGKEKQAHSLAEELYEKFPREYHLMSLCKIVSPDRKEELLNEHESLRLGESVSPDYVNMLITLSGLDRLSCYLENHREQIHAMDGETREELAIRLESFNRKDLAKMLRRV